MSSPGIRAQALVIALLLALGGGEPASAEGEEAALERLLAGGSSPSEVQLQSLAAIGDLDPWLLVEGLLARSRRDLAHRLAALVPEEEVGPIAAYVGKAPDVPDLAEFHRRLALAEERLAAADGTGALEALGEGLPPGQGASVSLARAAHLRARGFEALKQPSKATDSLAAAAEAALKLGWWRAAGEYHQTLLITAFAAGNLEAASRAAEGLRALEESRREPVGVADAEHNWAAILTQRGDLPGALRHFDVALALYETLGMLDELADVRSLRSAVLADIGDFRAALEDQRVLDTFFQDRPHDARWATHQVRLGIVRLRMGDERQAAVSLSAALDAFRANGDLEGEQAAYGNLGVAHRLAGRWDQAQSAYRSALAIAERRTDEHGVALARIALASAIVGRAAAARDDSEEIPPDPAKPGAGPPDGGTLAEARILATAALEALRAEGADGEAVCAEVTLGQVLAEENDFAAAQPRLERSRNEAARLRTREYLLTATATLARLHLARQDWKAALREARLGVEQLETTFADLGAEDLARARSRVPDMFDVGIRAAVELERLDDLAWFMESGRSAALLRSLGGRAAFLRAAVPQALEEGLAVTTEAKAKAFALYQTAKQAHDPAGKALWKAYEAVRDQEIRVLEEVHAAQQAGAARVAPPRIASIGNVQAQLRRAARDGPPPMHVAFNLQRDFGCALVIRADGARVVRYAREDLEALRPALQKLVLGERGELDPEALQTVRARLVAPLGIGPGRARLILSPDRELAFLPMSALVPDGTEVAWTPSGTTSELLAEQWTRRGRSILALGDPDYRAVPDVNALASRGGPNLVALRASREEVEAIASKPGDVRLLGSAATEGGLAAALRAVGSDHVWRSVHLSCHGLLDVERPALSCLALTPGAGEDGFLSTAEILRLRLRTDLAVLSACQTGRGQFVRSEGVMGLVRAFMFAGAPRVLASLWLVDDDATGFLIQRFYEHVGAGKGAALALRLAQEATRDHEVAGATPASAKVRHWKEPKFWAAWTLWGLAD